MTPVVLCDVDEVVADLHSEWLYRYNEKYNDNLTPDDITDWNLSRLVKPECGDKVFDFLRMPDLYQHVRPVEGAKEGVDRLRDGGYRVIFVTSCVIGSMDQKARWLLRHGFISDRHSPRSLVIARDKFLVRGDVLIDDAPHNLEPFPGHKILVDRPYNRAATVGFRARDWNSIVQLIQTLVPRN